MSNEKTLLDQIDDLVATKTFNLDALEGIKAIKDELKHTLSNLEAKTQMLDLKRQENCDLRDELSRRQQRVEELQSELSAMRDVASKGADAIWEKKIAEAGAAAYKDALQTVFKPNTVRETVFQSIPLTNTYNGCSTVAAYHQETRTTKEEI